MKGNLLVDSMTKNNIKLARKVENSPNLMSAKILVLGLTIATQLLSSSSTFAGGAQSKPDKVESSSTHPLIKQLHYMPHLTSLNLKDNLRNPQELSSVNAYSSSKVSSRTSQESQKDLSPASDPTAGGGVSQSSSHSGLASERSRDSVRLVSPDLLTEPLPPTKRLKSEFDPH